MNLKFDTLPLEVEPIFSHLKPRVSALSFQSDGTLLCGLLFAKTSLLKLEVTNKGSQVTSCQDQKLEALLENDDVWGIMNGLRSSLKGDTAFCVLHGGGGPSFLRKMMNKTIDKVQEENFFDFLVENATSGMAVKHSIVQIQEDRFKLRFFKQPGALLDAAHIGDFIFGLDPSSVFREPYLNSEKRYVLRNDLLANGMIHKQESGYFWFVGSQNRIMRLGQTDNKAIPTTKVLPGAPFSFSASSETDGCLYGVCNQKKTLFRLRNNPVTREDELEILKTFEGDIELTSLFCIDREKKPELVLATKLPSGVQFYSMALKKFEDEEMMEEAAPLEKISAVIDSIEEVFCFTGDIPEKGKCRVWAGARQKGGQVSLLNLDL